MKLFDPKRTRHLIALILAGMFLVPSFAWGINTVATGFKVETTDVRIDGYAYSKCHYVGSKTSTDWFVPTKTEGEWDAFLSKYSASELSVYGCGVPDNNCRVKYEHKTDKGITPTGYTGYTNNTSTYAVGGWVKDRFGDDDHCDNGCGVRAGVQCKNTDYAIRVSYEYQIKNVSGGVKWTPWSNSSTGFGAWSDQTYGGNGSDQECPAALGGCKLRMTVETNNPAVTCSIGYQHRIDNETGNLAYDGAWSTFSHDTGDGENCEKSNGCGMVVRLSCDGPGGSNTGGTSGSGGGSCSDGACSGADGSSCNPAGASTDDGICLDSCCINIGPRGGGGGGNPFDPNQNLD